MDREFYWKSKMELLEARLDIFENKDNEVWTNQNQILVRKLIIAKMMNVSYEEIVYYLERYTWLRQFALDDIEPVKYEQQNIGYINEKVDKILKEIFYLKDIENLQIILEKESECCQKPNPVDLANVCLINEYKEIVCGLIKDALAMKLPEDKIRELPSDEKIEKIELYTKIDIYEKIYFEPIELLNEDIAKKIDLDTYYTILCEQWKTANEMAANISEQRSGMNNFYMSLMSILIVGGLFSDKILVDGKVEKSILCLVIGIIGFVGCKIWNAQIDNYARLNGAKYEIINALERQLPANVMLYEYQRTEKSGRKERKKINFSEQEKKIVRLFRLVIVIVPIVMGFSIWWSDICTGIQMLLSLI